MITTLQIGYLKKIGGDAQPPSCPCRAHAYNAVAQKEGEGMQSRSRSGRAESLLGRAFIHPSSDRTGPVAHPPDPPTATRGAFGVRTEGLREGGTGPRRVAEFFPQVLGKSGI